VITWHLVRLHEQFFSAADASVLPREIFSYSYGAALWCEPLQGHRLPYPNLEMKMMTCNQVKLVLH